MSARVRRSVIATSRPPRSSARPLSACEVDARVDALAAQRRRAAHAPRRRRSSAARTRARPAARGAARRRRSPRSALARVVRCARSSSSPSSTSPAPARASTGRRRPERVQRLRRADVRGRLLAADVLLARLQRQHEAAPAVDVARLARDPPGHPPQVLLARREEAERRAAEVEAVAERLALADARRRRRSRPGGSRIPSVDRVDLRDRRARRGSRPAAASSARVLDRAVGSSAARRRPRSTCSSIAAAHASGSVTPSRSADLGDRRCRSPRDSVRSVSRACGCTPRETTNRAAPVVQLRAGSRPPRSAEAPS